MVKGAMKQLFVLVLLFTQLSSDTMLKRVTPSLDLSINIDVHKVSGKDNLDFLKLIQMYNESYGDAFDRYYNKLPQSHQDAYSDVAYLPALSFSFLFGLWLLPESITQWDKSDIGRNNVLDSWLRNVQIGPVIDQDKWAVNYIGHTLGGAYYHTLARNNGMDFWESVLFNFNISTFYWEYGVEAMFEKPSIQDLWITPVLGSMLGEVFYQLQLMIIENDGEVLGSRPLGNFFMVFFNPEGALADVLRDYFQTKRDVLDMGFTFHYRPDDFNEDITNPRPWYPESYFGFYIKIIFSYN
jgi:hypothetical protein